MSRVSIEVDDVALAVAGTLLGTGSGAQETVNAALHEVIAQRKRLAVLERMMLRSGETVPTPDPWRKNRVWL
ncbi:type II toxin-antitoxin system VapB family antitoxin [Nocardia shimofusensis]|uniref:type II toxin-antitoxin system VapB family antitoxin n=1 Tax=Nocardia shimofusensis TaxID=228596 RepID=UPI00083219E7|nr:type II toxin-antitoxin system VapB family antitoxin [Nocardia shimofusensis]